MDNATEPDDIPHRFSAYMDSIQNFINSSPEIKNYKEFYKCTKKCSALIKKYKYREQNIENFFQNYKGDSQDRKVLSFYKFLEECQKIIDGISVYNEDKNLGLLLFRLNILLNIFEKIEKTLNLNYFKSFQNDQFLEDLKSYINVAETTVSSPSAAVFLRAIESNISSYQRRTERPFSAIIGPSFMGKTQMAFILAAFKYPVLYFNFSASESDQNVYRNFSEISKYMYRCLVEDLRIYFPGFKDYISPATSELLELEAETNQYKSLGFIYALIERASKFNFDENPWLLEYYKLEPIYYESMCINDFNAKYGNYALILILFI